MYTACGVPVSRSVLCESSAELVSVRVNVVILNYLSAGTGVRGVALLGTGSCNRVFGKMVEGVVLLFLSMTAACGIVVSFVVVRKNAVEGMDVSYLVFRNVVTDGTEFIGLFGCRGNVPYVVRLVLFAFAYGTLIPMLRLANVVFGFVGVSFCLSLRFVTERTGFRRCTRSIGPLMLAFITATGKRESA